MTSPVLIALAIILVIFAVVVVHEVGYFVAGKLAGIRVDEFSIGFGPKLFARTRGETQYSLRLLPLGGYVRMAGMLGFPGESDAGERNFYRAGIPTRFVTIAAGIIFNFIFAVICFTIVNMAQAAQPWAEIKGFPVAAAGVPNGAVITEVNGRPIRQDTADDTRADLRAAVSASQGGLIPIAYRAADGVSHTTSVKPALVVYNPVKSTALDSAPVGALVITSIDSTPVGTGDAAALLDDGSARVSGSVEKADGTPGAFFTNSLLPRTIDGLNGPLTEAGAVWQIGVVAGVPAPSFPTAVGSAVIQIPSFIHDTFVGIYQLITGAIPGGVNGPQGLSGPVGIAQATAVAAQNGFLAANGLVWWIGFISMNLGLINVLPIPFLDGGKLLFLIIEAIRRKRLDPRHEAIVSAVGLALVVLLLIYVTIGDVSRFGSQ